jgi:SnoaL-like domain
MEAATEDRAVRELIAIEEIKRLKARYFRFIDSRSWAEWPQIFTDDATFEFEFPPMRFDDPQSFVAMSEAALEGARSFHSGCMPEIQLTSEGAATGIWAMEDRVELPPDAGPSFHGYGHYHEDYRRVDGRWKIASLRLTRVRVDQVGGVA